MNNTSKLIFLILFSFLAQNTLAKPLLEQPLQKQQNRYELNTVEQGNKLYLNHSFYSPASKQFLNISSRTGFDAKGSVESDSELYITTNKGTLIITKEGIMSQIDGHNEFITADEKSLQKVVVQSFIEGALIENMKQEIERLSATVKSGGACGAATTGAAHAVGEYAAALFSGDFEGANFWYSVYQGHVFNMRVFCEIK